MVTASFFGIEINLFKITLKIQDQNTAAGKQRYASLSKAAVEDQNMSFAIAQSNSLQIMQIYNCECKLRMTHDKLLRWNYIDIPV
jgi:hypothetical protein